MEGDVFLLSNSPYTVASEPAVEATDGTQLFASPGQDLVRLGDSAETIMVGGGNAPRGARRLHSSTRCPRSFAWTGVPEFRGRRRHTGAA